MNQEDLIKIFASSAKVAKKTSENLKNKTAEYFKEEVLNNEFVTREEFTQLRDLVLKLSKEIESVKKPSLDKKNN